MLPRLRTGAEQMATMERPYDPRSPKGPVGCQR